VPQDLHGHNDRGLGTANSLTSIFHGFQTVEGGVAGFGNRAGLPVIEALSQIFDENNITVASGALDREKLSEAARLAEDTYLAVPDPYRPVSGMLVRNENAGIVNVPDYLGVSRPVDYFMNQIGLFPVYVRQMLTESGLPDRTCTGRSGSGSPSSAKRSRTSTEVSSGSRTSNWRRSK
jgi:2-isopropylmalate synthase